MAKRRLAEEIRNTASNFELISNSLFDLAHEYESIPKFSGANKMISLARSAEENTVNLRNLTARSMGTNLNPYYEETSSALNITVKEEKRWIVITVPAILPGRNARDNTLFLTKPLRSSLIAFQSEQPIERFSKCAICIVHQYDEALGIKRVRDYDNIETKRYLDVIESFFLTSDSGLYCSVLQTTAIGDRDRTKFYLMIPQSLPFWVNEIVKAHT